VNRFSRLGERIEQPRPGLRISRLRGPDRLASRVSSRALPSRAYILIIYSKKNISCQENSLDINGEAR
jgi:hypothetical protein